MLTELFYAAEEKALMGFEKLIFDRKSMHKNGTSPLAFRISHKSNVKSEEESKENVHSRPCLDTKS